MNTKENIEALLRSVMQELGMDVNSPRDTALFLDYLATASQMADMDLYDPCEDCGGECGGSFKGLDAVPLVTDALMEVQDYHLNARFYFGAEFVHEELGQVDQGRYCGSRSGCGLCWNRRERGN